jgi:hypothetical protein
MKLQLKSTANFNIEFHMKEVFCDIGTEKKPKLKINLQESYLC